MALSERRVLHSVRVLFGGFAEFEWRDQVLRDGEVISEASHNGAYPIMEDGTFDSSVATLEGVTVSDIMGEHYVAQADQIQSLNVRLQSANESISLRNQAFADLQQQLTTANIQIAQLSEALAQASTVQQESDLIDAGA